MGLALHVTVGLTSFAAALGVTTPFIAPSPYASEHGSTTIAATGPLATDHTSDHGPGQRRPEPLVPPGPGAAGSLGGASSRPTQREVRLPTGDTVIVTSRGGRVVGVHPQAGKGRSRVSFEVDRVAGGAIVVPSDVAGRVATGKLDRARFVVAGNPRTVGRAPAPKAAAPAYTLRVVLYDRNGRRITDPNDPALDSPPGVLSSGGTKLGLTPKDGAFVATLGRGVYALSATIATRRPGSASYALVTHAPFSLTSDKSYALDARNAVPISVHVDAPDATLTAAAFTVNMGEHSQQVSVPNAANTTFYATPTSKALAKWRYSYAFTPVLESSHGTYELLFGAVDQVPASQSYTVRDGALASRRVHLSARGTAQQGHLEDYGYSTRFFVDDWFPATTPGARTLLVPVTGPDGARLLWRTGMIVNGPDTWEITPFRTYAAGQKANVEIGHAGFQPVALADFSPNEANFSVAPFLSAGSPTSAGPIQMVNVPASGTSTLKRGSTVVASSSYADGLLAPMPLGTAPLTLTTQAERTDSTDLLPMRTTGSWTFDPPAAHDGRLPAMLGVDVTGAFDPYGRAPADHDFTLTLKIVAQHADTAGRVDRPTLELSYDDGATWSSVPVVAHGPTWTATPRLPKVEVGGQAYASYRVTVRDDRGNAYDSTTIRGFVVRG